MLKQNVTEQLRTEAEPRLKRLEEGRETNKKTKTEPSWKGKAFSISKVKAAPQAGNDRRNI